MATDTAAAASAPTGHPIGFWFFFWGEFAERCSYYGMRAILALYMVDRLGVDKKDAGTFMSLFIAACYFFPLIGGYIADNFFGKYWTIVGFSVPYVVAQFVVGIENKYTVFGALALLAMGSGVIKPNISTLMGMTYDQQRPGQDQLRTSAFSWFYMSINIGAALSQFGMPWLRTTYGYQVAFLFPAGLMAMALFIFALGKKHYAKEKIVKHVVGGDPDTPLAEGKTLTGIPIIYKVVTPEEKAADRAIKMQVLGRIALLFLTVMFFWAIFDQSASTWIFFADTYMDCTLFGIPASADAIQAFNPVFIVLLVPVSVWLFKSLEKKGYKVKATQKMTVGFILTGLSMVIMAASGFLAGKKQDMMKLTTPEGSLILPMWKDQKIDSVTGNATAGTDVRISATDFAYEKDKKKLNFKNGKIILKDGREFTIAAGHLATSGLPDAKGFTDGGVAEPLIKSAEAIAKIKPDPEKDTATLEVAEWVKPEERVTVWWQVFAFLIITIAEILISVTGLELAFVAAPQSMKSFVTACWLAVVFLANLLINAPITRLYPLMEPGMYFAMLAGAMAFVSLIFIPVAIFFNKGMAKAAEEAAAKAAAEGGTAAT